MREKCDAGSPGYVSVSSYLRTKDNQRGAYSTYGDTNLGGSSSLCQAPNQTESSPQVREVRRKKRVVLQRLGGLGLYVVS